MKFRTFLLGLSALFIAIAAAYFSITGLSKLFAGASMAVILMASSLEFGKLISASFLYAYWDKINKLLRTYLVIGVSVLVLITSAGIYGFLTSAYQVTADQLEIMDKGVSIIELKKERFEEQLQTANTERETLSQSINELSKGLANNVIQYTDGSGNLITTTSSATRNALERQLTNSQTQRDNLSSKIEVLTDSVTRLDIEILNLQSDNEVAGEIGTLKYLAEITGQPMSKIINWFALMIVFVFDPLAVTLIIAFNTAMKIDSNEKKRGKEFKIYGDGKPLEPELSTVMDEMLVDKIGNQPTKERFEKPEKEIWDRVVDLKKKGKLGDDTTIDDNDEPTALANSQYRLDDLSHADIEKILKDVENPVEPNDELKRAAKRYKEFMGNVSHSKDVDKVNIIIPDTDIRNMKIDFSKRAIDTDGDGIYDGYDTNGDGLIDEFRPNSSSRWRYAKNRKPYYARPEFNWNDTEKWIKNQNAINYYLTYIKPVRSKYPDNFDSKTY
jgi:hypothetical protein